MSFSKAKLKRFNDVQSCTPSPADYNVAGASNRKNSRLAEAQSPSQSENGSSLSHSSVPIFRTPGLSRKLKLASNADRKGKPAKHCQCPASNLEALKEKTVECDNKDLFIQDLTEQLEEVKQQMSNLQFQLQDEVSKGCDLRNQYQHKLDDINQKIFTVANRMDLMKQGYAILKEECKHDLSELLRDVNILKTFCENLQSDYAALLETKAKDIHNKDEQIQQLENQLATLKHNHELLVSELREKHQAVETEMVDTITNMQNRLENQKQSYIKALKEAELSKETEIKRLQSHFETEKQRLREKSQLEVKHLIEDYKEANILAEMQMNEKFKDCEATWKLKLKEAKQEADDILKECQAIAEYNIIQCEIEKNRALCELSEKKQSLEALKSENATLKFNYEGLERKCQQVEMELNGLKLQLSLNREAFDKELAANGCLIEQLKKDKHMYEVTITKTHKTVETLKRRLMCSDRDVEQLKAELEATEESKLEIEEKCNQLMDELQIVCGLCDDMNDQNQLVMQVAQEKILQVEQELMLKVEQYKDQAEAEISKTREELAEVMKHLHEQQMLNERAKVMVDASKKELENFEQVNQEQATELAHLTAVLGKLQMELVSSQERETVLATANSRLLDENRNMKDFINQTQADKTVLLHCECKEAEKCKLLEGENRTVQKKVAEQDALIREHPNINKMENRKMAKEILSQQCLMDLKTKNNELCEEKKELEKKLFAQTRIVEKLRKELSACGVKPKKLEDKENIGSPNNSFSHIRSPGTPLRDRN